MAIVQSPWVEPYNMVDRAIQERIQSQCQLMCIEIQSASSILSYACSRSRHRRNKEGTSTIAIRVGTTTSLQTSLRDGRYGSMQRIKRTSTCCTNEMFATRHNKINLLRTENAVGNISFRASKLVTDGTSTTRGIDELNLFLQ